MSSSRTPALGRWATLGLALLSLSACKAKKEAAAPEPALDDIAAIEAELAANADRLQAQGVTPRAAKSTTSDAAVEDDAAADGAGAVAPSEPVIVPEPEPEPAAAPAAEERMDEGPGVFDRPRRRASAAKEKDRRRERTRCERICDLEASTCDLADRICGLADAHVDDVRYEEACERAEAQCDAAADACSNCVD